MAEAKTKTLNARLVAIQSELKAPKNQYNSFGKYKYRSCEDILEALKPLLAKYDVSLRLQDNIEQIGERYYVKAEAVLTDGVDSLSATSLAREPSDKKGMDTSQITGTASSYARKYALNGLFLIDDTKDADTEEYSTTAKSPRKTTQKQTATSDSKASVDTIKLIKSLKQQVINAGIKEEGINEWFKVQFGDTPITQLDGKQRQTIINYLTTLSQDKAKLNELKGE